ncbi:hypothetical protein ES703_08247 [subsurface metagenome]
MESSRITFLGYDVDKPGTDITILGVKPAHDDVQLLDGTEIHRHDRHVGAVIHQHQTVHHERGLIQIAAPDDFAFNAGLQVDILTHIRYHRYIYDFVGAGIDHAR